jgi:hypothetical protein
VEGGERRRGSGRGSRSSFLALKRLEGRCRSAISVKSGRTASSSPSTSFATIFFFFSSVSSPSSSPSSFKRSPRDEREKTSEMIQVARQKVERNARTAVPNLFSFLVFFPLLSPAHTTHSRPFRCFCISAIAQPRLLSSDNRTTTTERLVLDLDGTAEETGTAGGDETGLRVVDEVEVRVMGEREGRGAGDGDGCQWSKEGRRRKGRN